jgi:hypothetical protein
LPPLGLPHGHLSLLTLPISTVRAFALQHLPPLLLLGGEIIASLYILRGALGLFHSKFGLHGLSTLLEPTDPLFVLELFLRFLPFVLVHHVISSPCSLGRTCPALL